MKRSLLALLPLLVVLLSSPSAYLPAEEDRWVDSVFKTLTPEQKIAQLMVVRMSAINSTTRKVTFYDSAVEAAVRRFNVGGICLFQGGPLQQATRINYYQSISKTPILISIDAENGVGMRFDSVTGLNRQMMLGAVQDPEIIYEYGRVVGAQCKRIGIQVNYAPDVDVNNNPANPVINDRSFGEDKFRVALYGIQYMKGMKDMGILTCAKHFPGHGDVSVDSHKDLPSITKSRQELDSLELYPFRKLIEAGVDGMMVGHLSVPAIDDRSNRPTSLSKPTITNLLKNELGFTGMIYTDALEMQGVAKYYEPGDISVESLVAGNDMLCLPGDVEKGIESVKKAIRKKKLRWSELDQRVKKVLHAKFKSGLASFKPVELNNLTEDLNREVSTMKRRVAEHAITVLRNEDPAVFPLAKGKRVAYVGFGLTKDNAFARHVRDDYDAQVYYFDYKLDSSKVAPALELFKGRYDVVVIGLHSAGRFPAGNFGISGAALDLLKGLQQQHKSITMVFGNPYIIKNFCASRVLVECYEDDEVTHQTAADLLNGRFTAKGKLPVSVCPEFAVGAGMVNVRLLPEVRPEDLGFNVSSLLRIDSIVNDAIRARAIPGAVVLVAKDGKIAFDKAYGYQLYDSVEAVYPETIYDLASVTKIMATTVSVMKLYDEGKIDLSKTLGDYLPWTRGTNKESLVLRDIMLHQAGLKAFIPFYRETIDTVNSGNPVYGIYARRKDSLYPVRVAENLYMRKDYVDTIYSRILTSEVGPQGKYIYSDLDFIFMGKIVEAVSGKSLEQYTKEVFYEPLGMKSTGFRPRDRFPVLNIAPTEKEQLFRQQQLQGDVHDPGAAMFGGVAGHAGLFSDAADLAILCQVFLNGGTFNGIHFFKPETIRLFTSYQGNTRRGIGFDKPERDNMTRPEPYPTLSASPLTFGHTGFTGTCVWIDPQQNLTYIFLSNRVANNGDANRFLKMSVRPKVHEVIYEALKTTSRL